MKHVTGPWICFLEEKYNSASLGFMLNSCYIVNRQMANTSTIDIMFHRMHMVCVSFDV